MKDRRKKRRGRKRTFPLFENPSAAQQEALGDPDELVRLAFSELTRCDHCGVLDIHTRRIEINGEKRWLHEDCSIEFELPECYPVLYQKRQYRRVPSDDELDGLDEDVCEELLNGVGTKAQVGAVVKLWDRWYPYRQNSSAYLE